MTAACAAVALAGAALAARLSEDPSVSVLLLEAGPVDQAMELHVPAAFSKLFRGKYDWNYDTVPQPQLEDRRIFWPRGKTLGGSDGHVFEFVGDDVDVGSEHFQPLDIGIFSADAVEDRKSVV